MLALRPSAAFSAPPPRAAATPPRAAATCCRCADMSDDPSMTMEAVRSMFASVRAHYRKTGEVDESQVCRNMMVTRVKDFEGRLARCRVGPSNVNGDGLFAARDIEANELVTFFPGDALMWWENGDRAGDMMIFFGAHVPQSERDAAVVANERVRRYELYASSSVSVVGDPARREDASYLGHLANDAVTCLSPEERDAYIQASTAAANVEPVLVESCHLALIASRSIPAGQEILYSYGAGYWLARRGHAGVGEDLRVIGAGPPKRPQTAESGRLRRALKQPTAGKAKGQRPAGSRKTRVHKSAKKAPARGFGADR